MKKIIEASDVIIEVLDARDPDCYRNKELEKLITDKGKKLIIVINKVDLVPPSSSR